MTREDWTVDRIHHALPHSASRQQLLRDVHLTPIEELPAVLERWATAAEQITAAADRIESCRVIHKVTGLLPEHSTTDDRTTDIVRDAGPREDRQRGAA